MTPIEELPLFTQPRSSETRRQGLEDVVSSGRAASQNERVKMALAAHGPCTRQDLAEILGLPLGSICRAVKVLSSMSEIGTVTTRTMKIGNCTTHREVLALASRINSPMNEGI